MADYVVRVEATTEEAEKKLKRVDQRVEKLEKGATIDIRLPSAGQTLNALQQIGSATANVAKQAIQVSKALNVGPGARLNDLEDLFNIVGGGAKKTVSAMELLRKSTPTNILGTAFSTASEQASNLAKRISNVGYEVFGLTQSVSILRQTFGGLFDETIGREIRLQEALLRTRTTLASTTDVAVDGKRITDPYKALLALEGPLDKTLSNIRRRSLDIAGTTSEAIVQVFGVVASQVGQFGGTLKDAEDLAITFAGALGTIGMSDPMLATQEIRSILSGTIDQNSVLARSLGLTNEDIQKAKTSTEGLVAFLQRRLEAFSAGQSIAAKGFAGIVSNIVEVRQEASRSLGKPLLQPLLDVLTSVYERLQLVFDQILKIADGLGRIGGSAFSGVIGGIKAAPILQGFSARDQVQAFKGTENAVAQVAVKIQAVIDGIRPIIARLTNEAIKAFLMLGDGLAKLAAGFVQFKFEQLKLVALNFANIASTLNATVIPALNQVLEIYGKILSQPIFQFLSQVNLNLQLLERVGVLPVLRLGIAFVGIAGSVKVVIGWIKTAAEAVKTGLTFAINTVANSIQGLGAVAAAAGETVVAVVTTIATKTLLILGNLVKRIGVILIEIAVGLQAAYPQFGQLAVAVSGVGKAFINIEKSIQSAGASIKKFAQEAKAGLGEVKKAANDVADKTRNIGATVGGFAKEKLGALGGFLKDNLISLLKFQATLFLIEKGIAFVITAITQLRKSQTESSEQTRAELAVKRLSTVYADLGDNASAAARALKQAEEDIVNNRLDSVIRQYTELNNKLNEIQSLKNPSNFGDYARIAASMFNPQNFDIKPQKTGKYSQEKFIDALVRQRRSEASRLKNELNRLGEFQDRQKNQTQASENVQVLARERKDIETAIAEYRKEIERDLADERFRTAREVAQLEQQLAEENRRIERAELDRRLTRESEGLTGVRANISKILGDYERGLFDAQTEAQRKQFELVQARENLEKTIADYKYKLEEQTTRMRKRIGDYNKQVADYESAQAKRRDKERIQTALKAAAIEAERFVLGPEETRKFKDAAASAGVSSTQALALLKTPGVIDFLGIVPDGNYPGLIAALQKSQYGKLLAQPQGQFINSLDMRQAALGQGAGRFTYDTAVAELGNQREFQRTIAPPPKLKGFEDFSKSELPGFVAERAGLGQRILNLTKSLNDLLLFNSNKETVSKAREALSNPNLLTDLPGLQTAGDQAETAARRLALLSGELEKGARRVDSLTTNLSDFDETVKRSLEEFVLSRLRSYNARRAPGQRLTDTQVVDESKLYSKYFTDAVKDSIASGKPVISQEFSQVLTALGDGSIDLVKDLLNNVVATRKRIQAVTPLLDREARLTAVAQDVAQTYPALQNLVRDRKFDVLNEIGTLLAGDSPLKQRRLEGAMINLRRTAEYRDSGKILEDKGRAELEKLNAATTASYESLGQFDQAIKSVTDRLGLAREIVQSMSDGFKNVFKALITQGDVRPAIDEVATKITDSLLNSALESAFKPAKDMLESQFQSLLGVNSEQTKNTIALSNSTSSLTALNSTTNALITSNTTLATTMAALPAQIQQAVTAGAAATASGTSNLPTSIVTPTGASYTDTQIQQAGYDMGKELAGKKEQSKLLKDLNKGFSVVTQTVVGVTMAFDGLKRVTEGGGTYETLMGLSSIFMGVGSVLSGIGSIGKKAAGGPVYSHTPYLVGEMGPELFVPGGNGSIIPNSTTAALLASRNALGGQSTAAAADAFTANRDALSATASLTRERSIERYLTSGASSTEIKYSRVGSGDLPFVTENDMLQATRLAAQEGARMGQQRTLAALRNDPSTRRAISI